MSNKDTSDDGVPLGRSRQHYDLIERGVKKPSPLGTCTFVLLRSLDVPLQYAVLSPSVGLGAWVLGRMGLQTIGTAAGSSASGGGLGTGAILVAMSAGATMKQVLWLTHLSAESFGVQAAASVSTYNTTVNSINSLLFLALATSSTRSWPQVSSSSKVLPLSNIVGTLLFVTGIAIETASEWQRKEFKASAENKGKVCKRGLWSWARHINYLGYSMWRGGYCMAASGWLGGLAMMALQGWDLSHRAVASLDAYCAARYKGQWDRFKKEVPYKIIPGVY